MRSSIFEDFSQLGCRNSKPQFSNLCLLERQWYSDVILRQLDVTKEIVFDVFDWNAVLSHRKIGKAKLELSGVPPNGQHYELKLDDNEGVLNVFVKILWPQSVETKSESKTLALYPLRMHLERTVYHPGEVIRGHLILNLKKRTKLAEISIEASMKIDLRNEYIAIQRHPYLFYAFYDKVKVGAPNTEYEAGLHVFAFQFLLPEKCLTHSSWNVECLFEAVVVKKPGKTLTISRQRIMVAPVYDLLSPQVCTLGLPHDLCPEPLQGIVATFNPAPPKYIFSRDPFVLDVTLLNDSNATLSKFRVDLVAVRVLFCHEEKKNKWHSSKVVYQPASAELNPKLRLEHGQSMPIQVQVPFGPGYDADIFSVPPEMQPQTLQVFHHLLISAKDKTTGKRVVCVRHPVFVLNKRMLREGGLDNHMPDLEPAKLRVSQVLDLSTRLSLMVPSQGIGNFRYRDVPGLESAYLARFEDVLIGDSLSDDSFYQLPPVSNLAREPPSMYPYMTSAIPGPQTAMECPRDLLH